MPAGAVRDLVNVRDRAQKRKCLCLVSKTDLPLVRWEVRVRDYQSNADGIVIPAGDVAFYTHVHA